ncbi:MAG: flavodoxin family protein [Christensenellaceae bacterium]
MPYFCKGCFSCFSNGEQTCPHYELMNPIVRAMECCDVIVMTSPVYSLDMSGQMKAFVDHLSYQYMPHRPNKHLFTKKAVIVATTAGAGTKRVVKSLKTDLNYWGISTVYSLTKAVRAADWTEISEKNKTKMLCAAKKSHICLSALLI